MSELKQKRADTATPTENLHVVNEIVDEGLCVRCGACEPSCPVDIIRFDKNNYPFLTEENECLQNCTRCLKVCPGETVDFKSLDLQLYGVSPHPESVTGIARRALVSFSTDDGLRAAATSGGFVTQLLSHMLESGQIDGAMVLGASEDQSWSERAFIARTDEELRSSIKSKYRLVPYLKPLKEIQDEPGRYAIVALPCHLHAITKYVKATPKMRDRIVLTIGLYCNISFEPYVYDELCEYHGVTPDDIANLNFRSGEWPGGIIATMQDGSTQKLLKLEEMRDEFNFLKKMYTPDRCNMCTDFSAEYADIAVGDPWLRGPDGKFLFPDGRTSVLVRSKRGDDAINAAEEGGALKTTEIPLDTWMVNFERAARYKRAIVPQNLEIAKAMGRKVPDYNRELPKPTLQTRLRLLPYLAYGILSKYRILRRIGLVLGQTRPMIAFYAWNRQRKEDKFARVYGDLMKFVEKVRPPKALEDSESQK